MGENQKNWAEVSPESKVIYLNDITLFLNHCCSVFPTNRWLIKFIIIFFSPLYGLLRDGSFQIFSRLLIFGPAELIVTLIIFIKHENENE